MTIGIDGHTSYFYLEAILLKDYTSKDLRKLGEFKREYARKVLRSFYDIIKNILVLTFVILYEKFTTHHKITSLICGIIGIWGIFSIIFFSKEFLDYLKKYNHFKSEYENAEKYLGLD